MRATSGGRRWLTRNRDSLVFYLTIVVALLVAANLWKRGVLSLEALGSYKDAIGTANDVVTIVAIAVGGIFSYLKFFRGRIMAQRAELSISVSVYDTTRPFLLHVVTLRAKNVGSVTIWSPEATIDMSMWDSEEIPAPVRISSWIKQTRKSAGMLEVIEPGESACFVAVRKVPSDVWMVSYRAGISSDRGNEWDTIGTVSNTAGGTPRNVQPSSGSQDQSE
jgi:hypothetical protein